MTKKEIKQELNDILERLNKITDYADRHANKRIDSELVFACEKIESKASYLCDCFRFVFSDTETEIKMKNMKDKLDIDEMENAFDYINQGEKQINFFVIDENFFENMDLEDDNGEEKENNLE